MFWLDFGRCFHSTWWKVVSRVRCEKRGGKTRFNFKMTIKINATLSYSDKSRLYSTRLCKGHNHNTYQMSPNFLLMPFFVHSPLFPWHHLQNNTQTLWLGHDIQMLWYDWCEIHTLMRQSVWCNTYPNAAIWLVRTTYPLHGDIKFFS